MLKPEADVRTTAPAADGPAALEIRDLSVSFRTSSGDVDAVRGVDITVRSGTTHAIVGESGSGKSVTMMGVLGLLPEEAQVSGSIRYLGKELVDAAPAELRAVRGAEIGVIFQDPLSSLNPVMTVGAQILESMTAHRGTAAGATWKRAAELLAEVGIPEAERRVKEYPHQFSGGMRQRVMIAMALAAEPRVLIADEATTALDVTVQAQILRLVQRITAERSMTTIWISHDLGVVAQIADDITVMQSGRVVERGSCHDIFAAPREAYTIALLESMPRLDAPLRELPPRATATGTAAVDVRDLEVAYQVKRGLRTGNRLVRAVDDVSLEIAAGETVGLVGESGSGKSTFARALLGLEPMRHGTVHLAGQDVAGARRASLSALRRNAQMVFQDPSSSMNPGLSVQEIVTEPLLINHRMSASGRRARAAELLELVELDPQLARRHPHQLSGGQRQRVAIARALSLEPSLLVCDEPVSALDVTVQTQILGLLRRLQADLGVSLLVISHDLAVIRDIAHRVAVMYLGKIVEVGDREAIFGSPQHPYTRALLGAVPTPDPTKRFPPTPLQGDPPSPLSPPPGCRFHSRCPAAVIGRCDTTVPTLTAWTPTHDVACVRLGEPELTRQT
ncbi:ABC transporter ATP-binding protein [Agrococcus sediminis]|nr:ABC transporter ATP-binding protein [Agrococcus sediminis]